MWLQNILKLKASISAFFFLNSPPFQPLTDSPMPASPSLTPSQKSINTIVEFPDL